MACMANTSALPYGRMYFRSIGHTKCRYWRGGRNPCKRVGD